MTVTVVCRVPPFERESLDLYILQLQKFCASMRLENIAKPSSLIAA